jgi:hypothetical protein
MARAIHQIQAYPVASAVVTEAIGACHAHLAQMAVPEVVLELSGDGPSSDFGVAATSALPSDLSRRLRRARVAAIAMQRGASRRDLTKFCAAIVRCGERGYEGPGIAQLLAEDGVTTIDLRVIHQPEVLSVHAPTAGVRELLTHERRRRAANTEPGARTQHLFPQGKGWVRLDPAVDYESLTLSDMAILVDDPNDLAGMLHRLVDQDSADDPRSDPPLERRFSDLAMLFASLDPRLSRVMFGKLARAVLDMEPERRRTLLKQSVLPAVFDGRAEATILEAFPEPDLAESLCLLLDLETAAPALVATALDRLALTPERRAAVLPLIDAYAGRGRATSEGLDENVDAALDRQARRLTKVASTVGGSYGDFAAFDLTLDEHARRHIEGVRQDIDTFDPVMVETACLIGLIRIQPNPEVAAPFVAGVVERCGTLLAARRWGALAHHLARLRGVTDMLRESRPEVASLVDAAMTDLAKAGLAAALVEQYRAGEQERAEVGTIMEALGTAMIDPLILVMQESGSAAAAAELLCQRAVPLGAGIAQALPAAPSEVRHHLLRALGHAGPGYEAVIDEQGRGGDQRAIREAMRALARIGTAEALTVVASWIRLADGRIAMAALDALMRFPNDLSTQCVRAFLNDREFIVRRPAAGIRLLEMSRQVDRTGLDESLRALWSLRFRFWNRPLVRVARQAGALLSRP